MGELHRHGRRHTRAQQQVQGAYPYFHDQAQAQRQLPRKVLGFEPAAVVAAFETANAFVAAFAAVDVADTTKSHHRGGTHKLPVDLASHTQHIGLTRINGMRRSFVIRTCSNSCNWY
jgi:hypothetical protein